MHSKNICVVVLGDIGRSPRMQYHSMSLADEGHKVDIIGYGETQPIEGIKCKENISYHYLPPVPNLHMPKIFNYIFKTIWQSITLLFLFSIIRCPHIIVVQNPPAIPVLLVCWFYKTLARCKLVIDWHNYAHTILAMGVGTEHILVKITEKVEAVFGRRADYNFCVTNAMKKDLNKRWNISATTLYDRPSEIFKPIDLTARHKFLSSLSLKYDELVSSEWVGSIFNESAGKTVTLKDTDVAIMVSSTSWTEDEDFSVLLAALEEYEQHVKDGNIRKLPKLICFITGKGPLKDYYCNMMKQVQWTNVCIITPWLESKDYPMLLASADLGVCLHKSSSGLDLPMKVVDMFGCGLPVCAYKFECLDELVKEGKNGYTFESSSDLSARIQNWFEDFPNDKNQKEIQRELKSALEQFQKLRWTENWKNVAAPIFNA